MAVDLRTTQEYLNAKAGTVGLTKQQCLQYLAGAGAIGMTAQDAARNYAGAGAFDRSVQASLNQKVGYPASRLTPDVQQFGNAATEAFGNNGTAQKLAQSFIPTLNQLKTLVFQRKASTGTYTGNVTISIQGNNAGAPNGSAIVTTTINNATWEAITASTDSSISFSPSLTAGETYWIVFESSTQDAANCPNIAGQTGNPYANGGIKTNNGSAWSAFSTDDIYFRTTCAVDELFTEQEAARRL